MCVKGYYDISSRESNRNLFPGFFFIFVLTRKKKKRNIKTLHCRLRHRIVDRFRIGRKINFIYIYSYDKKKKDENYLFIFLTFYSGRKDNNGNAGTCRVILDGAVCTAAARTGDSADTSGARI